MYFSDDWDKPASEPVTVEQECQSRTQCHRQYTVTSTDCQSHTVLLSQAQRKTLSQADWQTVSVTPAIDYNRHSKAASDTTDTSDQATGSPIIEALSPVAETARGRNREKQVEGEVE